MARPDYRAILNPPPKHGDIMRDGPFKGSRLCTACEPEAYHGSLYLCTGLPPEVKQSIAHSLRSIYRHQHTAEHPVSRIPKSFDPANKGRRDIEV